MTLALLLTLALVWLQWAQQRAEDRELARIDLTPRLVLAIPAARRRRK